MGQNILQQALEIRELAVSLENIASDDKRPLGDYTDDENGGKRRNGNDTN